MAKTTDPPRPDAPAPVKKSGPAPKSRAKAAAKPAATRKLAGKLAKKTAAAKRRPARKTFLVAATSPEGAAEEGVRVYAAVTRSPEEALAAVRTAVGDATTVEFTGKLSGRMAKALGLTAGEVRRI